MKDESQIQQEIQIEGMHHHCNLLRNNSGACEEKASGRLIRFGLGNVSKRHNDEIASSDLIGITQVLITPDMVGSTLGVFTAIEVKKEAWNETKKLDKRETAQFSFINWVKSMGGYAGFANSKEKLKDILKV